MAEDPRPAVITSAANPIIKRLRSLAQRKYRDREKLFLAEGLRHVREALDHGWPIDGLVTLSAPDPALATGIEHVAAACRAQGGRHVAVNAGLMARLTRRDNPQAALGLFRQRWHPLETVRDGLWLALDRVRDPGNLGTILRTADAVAAAGVILIGDCCDPYSQEAVRASMGSFVHVPLVRTDQSGFLAWRPAYEGQIVGTHLGASVDYRHPVYRPPLILLMGNEQAGLSDALAAGCDQSVRIPMRAGADSLNLAVATGVLLYEAVRNQSGPVPASVPGPGPAPGPE